MTTPAFDSLLDLPLFQDLAANQRQRLALCFHPVDCAAGCNFFDQGQPARDIFILRSGAAIVRFYPYDGGRVDLQRLRPGDIFGWSALLARTRYTSAAECVVDSQALAASGQDLHHLLRQDAALRPILLERLSQAAAGRLTGFKEELARLLASPKERRSHSDRRKPVESLALNLPNLFGDHHVIEVRGLLSTVPGVDPASVFVSAAWQQVELRFDPAQTSAAQIAAVLAERGYTGERPNLPPVAARTKTVTEFLVGPGAVERFVEQVPAWNGSFGPCPGFEILHPGDVHPADK